MRVWVEIQYVKVCVRKFTYSFDPARPRPRPKCPVNLVVNSVSVSLFYLAFRVMFILSRWVYVLSNSIQANKIDKHFFLHYNSVCFQSEERWFRGRSVQLTTAVLCSCLNICRILTWQFVQNLRRQLYACIRILLLLDMLKKSNLKSCASLLLHYRNVVVSDGPIYSYFHARSTSSEIFSWALTC